MGLLSFFSPKKKEKSDLDSLMKKIGALAFPGGNKQIEEESSQLHALLRGRLSKTEAKNLLTRIKALLVIAKDKTESPVTQSIMVATKGKLTAHEAKLVYQFFTGVSGSLYSGGNGSSKDGAVIINATSSIIGINAEYKWIESHYGKMDDDWSVGLRYHGKSDTGKSYETFHIKQKDGKEVKIIFDISSFYGRF